MKMKTKLSNFMGCSKSNFKREVHSYTDLPQEKRQIPNKQLNFTPKGTMKRINKTQSNRKKKITKNRMEINETEILKII